MPRYRLQRTVVIASCQTIEKSTFFSSFTRLLIILNVECVSARCVVALVCWINDLN